MSRAVYLMQKMRSAAMSRSRRVSGVLMASLLLPAASVAQVAAPAPARSGGTVATAVAAATEENTESYTVAGIPVIHRRAANEVVSANLYLLGGTRQVTAANAGIEPFLLELSDRGTKHYPKDSLRRTMARLGTGIVVDPEHDWTMFGLRATVSTFESTWRVLADRLVNPTLDPTEVELVRRQFLSALVQRQDSPEALLEHLADSVAFSGHPYGISPVGSAASLRSITLDDLRRHHREQMVRSRMLLVVVGNVERDSIERLVSETLGALPEGDYAWTPPVPLPAEGSAYAVVPMTVPTNYILGYFAGPPATSEDYPALRVATAVLSGRMFHEIRVKRNLTYAVHSPFVERAVAAGGLYVTTVAPDTTLALMRTAVSELQTGTISRDGLEQLVQQFITEYFLDNETNSDQADFLAQAQLYRGDWRLADHFVDDLRRVTPEDIRRVANRYMRNVRFAYVGDPQRAPVRWFRRF